MRRGTHRLAACAVLWLVCQFGALAVAPPALCACASAAATVCTCAHGPGQACPMHHKMAPLPKGSCACRSTGDDNGTAALLATLLVPAVRLTPASGALAAPGWNPRFASSPMLPTDWLSPPDGPPPRSRNS
jgi:hypothetical protein